MPVFFQKITENLKKKAKRRHVEELSHIFLEKTYEKVELNASGSCKQGPEKQLKQLPPAGHDGMLVVSGF